MKYSHGFRSSLLCLYKTASICIFVSSMLWMCEVSAYIFYCFFCFFFDWFSSKPEINQAALHFHLESTFPFHSNRKDRKQTLLRLTILRSSNTFKPIHLTWTCDNEGGRDSLLTCLVLDLEVQTESLSGTFLKGFLVLVGRILMR